MNINLQAKDFELTPSIEAHVLKQLRLHLSNFAAHIVAVDVFLRDINGPKGGPDKKVLICTQLGTRAKVTVERTRTDLYVAVSCAVRQTKRAVRRSFRKRRHLEKLTLRELQRMPQQ